MKHPRVWDYETTLPKKERKMRGHFSTPFPLVEQILDACGYTLENDLTRLCVLDPACGSGNFLLGAARRLLASGLRGRLTPHALLTTLQRNLWGFDPDPVACFLAEMQMRELLSCADLQEAHPHGMSSVRFHIHQADGLTLPWEERAPVDIFLANPPYLAIKNNDLSGYQSAQHRGQVDSYLLFLDLALQVVRPDGWICLVLPDPVLARSNAAQQRGRLLADTTVHHLWHLSEVFPAQVGAVVIIAQKHPPRQSHSVSWIRSKWMQAALPVTTQLSQVPQHLLRSQPHAELRYLLSSKHDTLVGRLHASVCTTSTAENGQFVPLEHIVSIRRGEELGKKTKLLAKTPPTDKGVWYPVLLGGVDVQAYKTPCAQYWLAQDAIAKPLERYLAPKVLVVKSTAHLQATLDLRGHVALQTLYLLNLRITEHSDHKGGWCAGNGEHGDRKGGWHAGDGEHGDRKGSPLLYTREQDGYSSDRKRWLCQLYFLLALLNSRLLREYVYVLHTAYKWVQPQIEQYVLARLPIPLVTAEKRTEISRRARQLLLVYAEISSVVELKEHSHTLYEELELVIRGLYEDALSIH
ncbi:MAG: N-6 DNA methylase [Ktedonobacteraceae bacterium]|nr:N-6 DNA methylase [Ktedonobacteraceae bacterium]